MDFNEWNKAVMKEFRENAGKVGGDFEGAPLLILHTTGAKSGKERENPLMYLPHGDGTYIFASKAGMPSNPDWYYNLLANPQVKIEVGTDTVEATARVLEGEERDRIWTEQKQKFPQFAEYEKGTTRTIPVVALDRA